MKPQRSDILDRCLEEARAGRDPQPILDAHPDVAEEIRPLVEIADELGTLPDPAPSVGGLTKTLVKLAAEQAAPAAERQQRIRLFSRPVLARVAAVLVCLFLVGWGTTTAASGTVPGDFLYPVKLLTENVQFWLALGAEDQVELRMRFSERRLKEAVKKHRRGDGLDRALLHAMLAEADQALAKGPDLPNESRALMLLHIACLVEHQKEALEGLAAEVKPKDQLALGRFIQMCDHRCSCARSMVPRPGRRLLAPPAGLSAPKPVEGCTCPVCR